MTDLHASQAGATTRCTMLRNEVLERTENTSKQKRAAEKTQKKCKKTSRKMRREWARAHETCCIRRSIIWQTRSGTNCRKRIVRKGRKRRRMQRRGSRHQDAECLWGTKAPTQGSSARTIHFNFDCHPAPSNNDGASWHGYFPTNEYGPPNGIPKNNTSYNDVGFHVKRAAFEVPPSPQNHPPSPPPTTPLGRLNPGVSPDHECLFRPSHHDLRVLPGEHHPPDIRDALWMDKLLHHFETMRNHWLLVFTGESSFQAFLRWCRIPSIHSMAALDVEKPRRTERGAVLVDVGREQKRRF